MNHRNKKRKYLNTIKFEEFTVLNNYKVIIDSGYIVDASVDGFRIELDRSSLKEEALKNNLSLDSLLGAHIAIFLPQMAMDLDGFVMRTSHNGNGNFSMYIEFSSDVPEYWRDCLIDLLPTDEDLEDMSFAS